MPPDPMKPDAMLDILQRVEDLLAQAARLREDIESARLLELHPPQVTEDRRRGERRRGSDRRRA